MFLYFTRGWDLEASYDPSDNWHGMKCGMTLAARRVKYEEVNGRKNTVVIS